MNQSQVDGINAILDTWETPKWQDCDMRWLAYMLATAHHETDRTMTPIEEYGHGAGRPYGKRFKMNGQGYSGTSAIFYGRGLVQLTWYENYLKAGSKLGIDLLQHPALALDINYAVPIMFYGMTEGWFTGRRLQDYFNSTVSDWHNARRIINGVDRAALVADYGERYLAALR